VDSAGLTVNAREDSRGTVQIQRMSPSDLWVHQMSPEQLFFSFSP